MSRLNWSAAILRGLPAALVFVFALVAFEAGVGVSDRASVETAGFLTHLYYTIGLFVLGGMDLGSPTGGPVWGQALLWIAYFLGPAITTSAVAEGLLRVLRPDVIRRLRMRDHVVLVGLGRHGTRYLDAVRGIDPDRPVLIVDVDPSRRGIAQERGGPTSFLAGDASDPVLWRHLALDRALGVVITTPNDLTNLEIATDLRAAHPALRVAALVADAALADHVAGHDEHLLVFNAHRLAARHLYVNALRAHFAGTREADTVVLLGFGRFGQTVLAGLQTEAEDELAMVIVVDRDVERNLEGFHQRSGLSKALTRRSLSCDLADPRALRRVLDLVPDEATRPVFVIATDDDARNLDVGLRLRKMHRDGRVFVRLFHHSAFSQEVAERYGFEVLAIDETLRNAFRAGHSEWFAPQP